MLEINIPEVVAEVTEAFQRYERALVANDVEALDALFWDNPNTLRFGIAENLYGYEAIASFRSTRAPIDLTRHLKNTVIVSYGGILPPPTPNFSAWVRPLRDGKVMSGCAPQTAGASPRPTSA